MQAIVVMHNQLNVFMTVPSLFPNEEFKRLCMVLDGWQDTLLHQYLGSVRVGLGF